MKGWPAGYELVLLDEVDSTNEEAKRRVSAGSSGPLWIAAKHQSRGRGRLGRPWVTSNGNLTATLSFPFAGPISEAARLGFHTSLAVADVLRVFAPSADIALKWPNDVLLNGYKVSGILLETIDDHSGSGRQVAVGVGLNLSAAPIPEQTRWPATSIYEQTGTAPALEPVLSILARRMDFWLQTEMREGIAAVLAAWRAKAARVGELIEVRLPSETLNGIFKDVDDDGALVLEVGGRMRKITAGDVFFPELT